MTWVLLIAATCRRRRPTAAGMPKRYWRGSQTVGLVSGRGWPTQLILVQ